MLTELSSALMPEQIAERNSIKMKKLLGMAMVFVMSLTVFSACGSSNGSEEITTADINSIKAETTTSYIADGNEIETDAVEKRVFTIAALKGPTTMGMVKLMEDSNKDLTANDYNVSIYGTADEIVTGLVNGSIDAAAIPANLSSVLYKKTEGQISVAAVNTLGVLYMVETGDAIKSVADLKGKTIYSTGKGTTPEYVLNYILAKNGLKAGTDVTVEYKSEATEVAAMLAGSDNAIALLPQPYVTVAQTKNPKIRVCLDLTAEWNNISDNQLITGVLVVRNDFLNEDIEAFDTFLDEYAASTEYVNAHPDEAAVWIDNYDIVPEAVAVKAIPQCNITFLRGADMKAAVESYLKVLYEQEPSSVGGALPDENFYYVG